MPTLVQLGSLSIRMYPNDHNPPHFHIVTPDRAAVVDLANLQIIAGSASAGEFEVALRWARANMETLKSEWERLNRRG